MPQHELPLPPHQVPYGQGESEVLVFTEGSACAGRGGGESEVLGVTTEGGASGQQSSCEPEWWQGEGGREGAVGQEEVEEKVLEGLEGSEVMLQRLRTSPHTIQAERGGVGREVTVTVRANLSPHA